MTIEQQVAAALAHRDRVVAILAETGGEVIHPDHYAIREALRLAVMAAIDDVTTERGLPRMSDGKLPELFHTVDAIANTVFLQSNGLMG